jgi:glycine cleavage system aminomethyltransferase T
VAVHAPVPSPPASLEEIAQRAGGVRTTHAGRTVITSYGSAAGELAACVTAVGLADCSQLTKLLLSGPSPQVSELRCRLTGAELAPGGAARTGGAWWCAESDVRTIVLCEPGRDVPVRAALLSEAPRHPGITVTDHTADWATLAVVGRRTPELLARLGLYGPSGDPRRVAPVTRHSCEGSTATWLLQTDDTAWAVLSRRAAPALWRALERAGRPLALCAVGHEAISRYSLLRRGGPAR